MLTQISATDLRGMNFRHDLAPVVIFQGANGRGKTTRLTLLDLVLRGARSPYWPDKAEGTVVEVQVDGLALTRSAKVALLGGAKVKVDELAAHFHQHHVSPWTASCMWGGDADERAAYLLALLRDQGLEPSNADLLGEIRVALDLIPVDGAEPPPMPNPLALLTAAITAADAAKKTAGAELRKLGSPLAVEALLEREPDLIRGELEKVEAALKESPERAAELAAQIEVLGVAEATAMAWGNALQALAEAAQKKWEASAEAADISKHNLDTPDGRAAFREATMIEKLDAERLMGLKAAMEVACQAPPELVALRERRDALVTEAAMLSAPAGIVAQGLGAQRDLLLVELARAEGERGRMAARLADEGRRAELKQQESAATARRDTLKLLRARAVRDALGDVLTEANKQLGALYPSPPPIRLADDLALVLGDARPPSASLVLLRSAQILAQVALMLALAVRQSTPERRAVVVLDDLEVVNAETRSRLVHVLSALVSSGTISQALIGVVSDGWAPPAGEALVISL